MHVGFKIESLHFMVVPHMVKLFHKLLLHDAMLENWIWSTAEPPCQISYNLWRGNQIDLQSYTAPTNFDFCLKDCTIGQQYSVRYAVRLAIGRIIEANNFDTQACAFIDIKTISSENSPSHHMF